MSLTLVTPLASLSLALSLSRLNAGLALSSRFLDFSMHSESMEHPEKYKNNAGRKGSTTILKSTLYCPIQISDQLPCSKQHY